MKVAVVIPALNPDERLAGYCRALREATGAPVLLVDDGSGADSRRVFDECRALADGVSVLRHDANRGKGRALKTAFAHLLADGGGVDGCVTCDADGQHAVEDVARCIEALRRRPTALVLGCRRFDGKDVPWKSRLGNTCMKAAFLLVSGYRFMDTQTGLRAIPADFMRELLDVPGERFEFESEMLLRLGGRPLVQIPVRTIYEDSNKGTHFRPVADSLGIVRVLARSWLRRFFLFASVSLASFALDVGLFHALHRVAVRRGLPGRLFLSVLLARCVSLLFNYLCNRHVAFRGAGDRRFLGGRTLARYLVLAGCLMLASYLLTKAATHCLAGAPVTLVKASADLFLFLASYAVQRTLVFRPGRD